MGTPLLAIDISWLLYYLLHCLSDWYGESGRHMSDLLDETV